MKASVALVLVALSFGLGWGLKKVTGGAVAVRKEATDTARVTDEHDVALLEARLQALKHGNAALERAAKREGAASRSELRELSQAGMLVIPRQALRAHTQMLFLHERFDEYAMELLGIDEKQAREGTRRMLAFKAQLAEEAENHIETISFVGNRMATRLKPFPEKAAGMYAQLCGDLSTVWPAYSVEIFRSLDPVCLLGGQAFGFGPRTLLIDSPKNPHDDLNFRIEFETEPGVVMCSARTLSPEEAVAKRESLLRKQRGG